MIVVWHENPAVQQTVDWLRRCQMLLVAGEDGLRAVTGPQPTVGQLMGDLLQAGFRPRFQSSGPSEPSQVGESRGGRRRPGKRRGVF